MSAEPQIAKTPEPPYYAVMFTSLRTEGDRGYGAMSDRMVALAARQPGYLGMESARAPGGLGITISYWKDEASIAAWKSQVDHQAAQAMGKKTWYEDYCVRVAKVERAYGGPLGR